MSKNSAGPKSFRPFDKVANVNIQRSKFDLSHAYKTTLDGGYLVPVMLADVLCGDSWTCDLSSLCRMTTPIVPFMDNVHLNFFAFAVPKRLLWDNFEDFWTGSHKGKVGTTHTTYPTRAITKSDWSACGLYDYLGIPCPSATGTLNVNALPLRAYNMIYSEWFRDENLINPIDVDTSDTDSGNSYALLRRCKRRDYFTSALPFVQKGPDVQLPLGSSAPVVGTGDALGFVAADVNTYPSLTSTFTNGTQPAWRTMSATSWNSMGVDSDPAKSGLVADLSNATAATINSLREAFAVQHLLERDARSGSRMVESIFAHFGVTCPDFRLQRPEYIGGGQVEFAVNSVPQTSGSQSGVDTPQGNLAAFAKSFGKTHFQYSAVEPCYIMVLACITCDLTYQQGLDRLWTKSVRTDEYWPEFSHLGEQPVYEREIYATGDVGDSAVFGYQERYAEYRYFPSMITGKLRSTDATPLDVWHLAQEFASAPSLSQDFIEENPPFARVLAVQNEPQFVLDCWFDCKAIRPLPMFATPGLIDHF